MLIYLPEADSQVSRGLNPVFRTSSLIELFNWQFCANASKKAAIVS